VVALVSDGYTFKVKDTSERLGTLVEFRGRGVHAFSNEVRLPPGELLEYQADRIARMLWKAYEQGRKDKAAEVRAVLEVK
jgi:hypothetical protein